MFGSQQRRKKLIFFVLILFCCISLSVSFNLLILFDIFWLKKLVNQLLSNFFKIKNSACQCNSLSCTGCGSSHTQGTACTTDADVIFISIFIQWFICFTIRLSCYLLVYCNNSEYIYNYRFDNHKY